MNDAEYRSCLNSQLQRYENAHNLKPLLLQLLQTPSSYHWAILQQILTKIETASESKFTQALNILQLGLINVKSFTMLIYLYSLSRKHRRFAYNVHWKGRYLDLCTLGGELMILSTFVSDRPDAQIVQDTLWLVVNNLPHLFRYERIDMGEMEVNAVIEWVTYLQTPDPESLATVCEIVKMAKQTPLYIRDSYMKKQDIILRKLMQVTGQYANSSSNIFLFIYPFTLRESDITMFCHINCDFITDLADGSLVNFFKTITRSSISKQIVFMIKSISEVLKSQEEFFKLRMIYQEYVLPILARRAKSCVKVEGSVFELCSFYILGFIKHCDIGEEGIHCILNNISRINNPQIREKWIEICAFLCHEYESLRPIITDSLETQLGQQINLNYLAKQQDLQNLELVWKISIRSGRKHKKYPRVPSKLKGIENKHNECYMISVVHGLQKGQLLENVLNEYYSQIKNKQPLLDELRILFSELSGKRRVDRIKISYLKRKGPEQFTASPRQEDAQQYLLSLLDSVECECKTIPGLLAKLKQIFEFIILNVIECKQCQAIVKKQENSYVYTIAHTEVLAEQLEETLQDYCCGSCKSSDCIMKTSLKLTSQILIVHINRFSHHNGKMKKQLSTQTILREFMGFSLYGMICHRGNNVENGHYIYYGRIGKLRWAQFNDTSVEEFELSEPNEQFEREMKSEMTPYILFYRKL